MIEFAFIECGLYRPDQVIVSYDPAQRMPKTAEMQAWMDEQWQQQLTLAREQGRRLFDAPLIRFVATCTRDDGTLHLNLGDTSYKEYVTTRTAAFAQAYPRHAIGNPLAVCSVVETSDNYILLDKREGVDVYVGRYHVIGGFFERDLDICQRPDPFAAMRREIREETGIQSDDIQQQFCLGIVYDLSTPHSEMCFLTLLNISLDEVLHNRTPEEDEIKQLRSLLITPETLREFILVNHGNISATGEPNLLMYGGWNILGAKVPDYIQIQTYATCDKWTYQEVIARYRDVLERLGCDDQQLLEWLSQISWPTSEEDSFGDIYAASFTLTTGGTLSCAGMDISLYSEAGAPTMEVRPAWLGFNLLFDAYSLRQEHSSLYKPEVVAPIWHVMRELESVFREIGVYLTDEWQENQAWRALAEETGNPWSFDLGIFPREQAEHFAVVPAGFQGTLVERDFAFAQENRWTTLPWSITETR